MKMIEITCLLNNATLTLDFNDKSGKLIHNFGYGQVLNEENCNIEDLKKSMESGILAKYLKKGWAVAKKVNVKGAIIGAPVEFKGITSNEVDAIMEAKMQVEAEKLGAKVAEPIVEPKPEAEIKTEASIPKKKTRKPKAEVKPINEIEAEEITPIKEEAPIPSIEEDKKEEDDGF